MKRALVAIAILLAGAVSYAAYQYYVTDSMSYAPYDTNLWTLNGSAPQSNMFYNVGSLISTSAVPDGTSDYEVRTGLSTFYGVVHGALPTRQQRRVARERHSPRDLLCR